MGAFILGQLTGERHDGETTFQQCCLQMHVGGTTIAQVLSHSAGEATRRIKAQSDLRHIPIIVVTSYALSGDDEKARAAGCDAYIAKPYSARKLLETINRYLI